MIIFVIVVGLTFGVGLLIWNVFHDQLVWFIKMVRTGELHIAKLMYNRDYAIRGIPGTPQGSHSIGQWLDFMSGSSIREITDEHIRVSTWVAVPTVRPFFTFIIALLALWAMFFGPNTSYRRKLDLQGLIAEQAKSFPAISPFVNFNPLTDVPFRVVGEAVPAHLPLFAEALSPEEWVAYNEIEIRNNQLDANGTYQALTKQLGARWRGPLRLPTYAQGLYAAFALRHARKRKESEELLGNMALCWTPENGLKLTPKLKAQITKVIKDPKLGGALQKYADKHAYTTTALLRSLQRAREEGGVLAPSMFLWLRGEDRNLWYPLNNLGRRSYHAEAVGALVHYTNELIAGQKIPTPRFDEVIKGVQEAVMGMQGRPVPPLDKNAKPFKFVRKKKK